MNPTKVCRRHPSANNKEQQENARKPSCNILKLPMDLTAEILHRLPGKSLVQCKYVCSSWRCWLLNPHFTKPLLPRTRGCLLIRGFTDLTNPSASATFLIDLDKIDYSKPKVDVALKLPRDPILPPVGLATVGSCNGLLCLVDLRVSQYYISNPITGESLALPTMPTKPKCKLSHMHIISGLGFCPVSRVYKVLCTFPIKGSSDEEEEMEAMVLTVGCGSWRSIGHYKGTAAGKTQKSMIYLNGSLHWINDYGNTTISICAFDVEREVFQQLPSFTVGAPYLWDCDLRVLRGCLSLFVNISTSTIYGDISFWVMNDYGVKESWTKECEIGSRRLLPTTRALEYTEEGQILRFQYEKLLVYTSDGGLVRVQADGIPSNITNVCVHIPSFVSLNDMIRGT